MHNACRPMPDYCYKITPGLRIVEEWYSGLIGVEYINQCLENMSRDKNFDPAFDIIVDFSDAVFDESCKSLDMLGQAAECHDRANLDSRSKTAVIVNSPFTTACAMLFLRRASTRNMEIFSTREAAEKWIGSRPAES